MFRCQAFAVRQANSAMKICSDSLLFGARLPVQGLKVADFGAGTGILSLIAAQHGAKEIWAVEMDRGALDDLRLNFEHSSWQSKFHIVEGRIQDFVHKDHFDLIFSNPPFFVDSKLSTDESRSRARHTQDLSYEELLFAVKQNLSPSGEFWALIPEVHRELFLGEAQKFGFGLKLQVEIQSRPAKLSHVSMLCLDQDVQGAMLSEKVLIWDEKNQYAPSSEALLRDLLLRFA